MDTKLKGIVGLVNFIIILDNNGKRIYAKYFTEKTGCAYLSETSAQKEFEKKICYAVQNLNVNKNSEVDIFSINEFMVVCKISKETAIFIGAPQDENECIIASIFDIFEECLDNLTKNSQTRKSILESYQQVGLLVDEMIDEGIVMNTDSESLENKVYLREGKSVVDSASANLSASASAGSSYGGSLFRNLLSAAKSYVTKNANS